MKKYLDLEGAKALINGIKNMMMKTTFNPENMTSVTNADIDALFTKK